MFALDLFNNDHERRLAEGAVDQLEQRRIDDLAMKMDDLVARAKTATTPEVKQALMKEFQKCKAERDNYYKIQDECMGYGSLGETDDVPVGRMQPGTPEYAAARNRSVKYAGLPDVADKAGKMARLNQPNKAGTDLATAQQRVNPNPNKGVVGHAVDWLRGKGGPGREGPTYESELDEAYGAVGSKALMNGNFAEFLKRRASREPYDMDFGSEKIRITPAIMDAIAKKYMDDKHASDASPKNRDLKQNAVNNYRSFGYPNLMKQLIDSVATPGDTPAPGEPGEQLPMFEKAQSFQKKKSDEPPLTGRDVKNTRLSRELTKARAAYPTARSDIEALVMRDLDHADQVDAELKTKQNTDAKQDQALQQAQAVNQDQAKNIQALQSRLSAVQQQLQIPPAKAVAPTQSTAKPTAEPVKQPGAAVRMPEPIYTEPSVAQDQDLRDKVKQLDDLAKAATMAALQRPDDKDMQAELKQQIDNLQKQIEKLSKKTVAKKKKKMTYKKVQKPGKEAPALPDPNVIDVDAFEIPTMDIPSQDDLIGAVPNDDTAQNDRPRELQKAAEGVEKPTGIGQMAKNIGQGQSIQNDSRYRKQVYQNQQDQARRQRTIARGKAGYGEEPDDFGDIPDMTEGAMSELDIERQDLERMTDQQFQRAYGISKEFWKYKNQALLKKPRRRPMSAQLARSPVGQKMTAMYGSTCPGCGCSTSPDRCICESTQRLHAGDPIIVTAPNEFEGATGEIYELSPSGKFVIVNLYNHGKHSMHLSDVEYNQYADDQDDQDLDEGAVNPQFIVAQVTKLLATEARRMTNAPIAQLLAPVMKEYNLTLQQIDGMMPGGLKRAAGEYGIMMKEGFQDFKKVEPYAVCLAGKPVKQFDYYEDARRFHDNWKKKLYREGNTEKADKITLMPVMDEGIKSRLAGAALAGAAALGGGAAHAKAPDAGALQQTLKQQISMKAPQVKPQVPIAQTSQPAFVNTDVDVLKQVAQGTMQHPNIRQVDAVKALQWLKANPGYQDVAPRHPKAGQYDDDSSTLHVYKPEQYRDVPEAANPAQQAAIAIAMKKAGKKPKQADEAYTPSPAKPFRNPRGFNKQGTGVGNKLADLNRKEWEEKKKKEQGVAEDTDSWFRVTVKTPNGKNRNIQVPANSHGTAKRKALAYCAKNGITGAEFVSAMRMPTLDEQGVVEGTGSWIVYDPETKQIKKRFKTHTAGKSYAQTHGLGFASSEYYFDRVKEKEVAEVAPPGAKAERMVKGIKKSLSKDGHLSDKDKAIAYATTWKAHNDSKVEEAQTDYQKRRQRERDVDAGRPVKPLPKNPQTDYARKRAKDKRDMEMGEGLTTEPTNRKEYLDQRDKLFRMLAVETNPANKQIIKTAIKNLDARYGSAKDPIREESSTSSEAVEIALIRRVLVAHTDLIMEFGLDKVTQAIEEVAYNVGDVDEIGSSDVSAWIEQVKQILGVE